MRRHFAYLKYVLRHKWFVFIEGLRSGVPLLSLIFHDWDKFLPDEWVAYARFFYASDGKPNVRRDNTGYYKAAETGNSAFDMAWLLHQKRNKHHWQWWTLPLDDGGVKVLEMPHRARQEMLADWRGAGRAQGKPNTWEWYEKNKDKMRLHPATREWIEVQLAEQKRYHEALEKARGMGLII